MCGRISLYSTPERLSRIFDAALDEEVDRDLRPSFNVPPTRPILGVSAVHDGAGLQRRLGRYRWGLVPSWAKDLSMGNRLFNARGETVATKPSFRAAFTARRLAVLADGFYEWEATPGSGRRPHYFERSDGEPLAFAGLWEQWWGPATAGRSEAPLLTCTIITTGAGPDLADIHDRMPVILERDTLDEWLDPDDKDRPELESLITASPAGTLVHHRVDPRVGNVRNDGPDLVEPMNGAE